METKSGSEYCRDPEWMKDAVSRFLESPVYSVPLLDFIDENCGMFEDSDDNKLEYTIVHESFKELVDGLISDFLGSLGIPVPTFVHMLANEVHASLYSIVVTSILTVDDFLLFKEMMLKRNFQISNQVLNHITNQFQELEGPPVDLHSVIDHLSDVSKQQQQSDKETAKSLFIADAFQQQAKVGSFEEKNIMVKDADSVAKRDPAASLSRALEEEKTRHEDHVVDHGDHDQEKGKTQPCPQHLAEHPKEVVVEAPASLDNSSQGKEPTREPSTSPGTESMVTVEDDSSKPNKAQPAPEHKRATKTTTSTENAASVMTENRKDQNPRTAKVSFETPQEVVFLGEPETEILLDGDDEEFGDDLDGARCVDSESQEHIKDDEQAPEPTTSKMLEDLLADVRTWKPRSLHLNVNDVEIQQRRRYLEQQRDRILAHKKSAREKQIRFFRQLESKAYASPQKLRRSTQPMPALPQDTEANKKRETLRKELARCLKEELSNKTSNMSPDSKKIRYLVQFTSKPLSCFSYARDCKTT